MTFGLTNDQIFAARPDLNVWLEASAGTGKTHVLTARVLRMMVQGTPPDHILGLTYTKAAAAEMAARIYKTLGKWAMVRAAELPAEIFRCTGEKADEDALARARTLFATVLDIPGGLKIQTIHSFCQSLLKRFPLEAGLPPHFSVMDDRTSEEYLKAAMDQVMLAATHGGDVVLREAFDHIATCEAEGGFEDLIRAFLGKRRKVLGLLRTYSGIDGLISATFAALGVDQKTTREGLIEEALKAPEFNESAVERLFNFIRDGSVTEKTNAASMAPFFTDKSNRAAHFDDYCMAFFTKGDELRKPFFVKATIEAHPDFLEIFLAEQVRLAIVREQLALIEVANGSAALIRLGSTILASYQQAKGVQGLLDYDDLILNTSALLEREGITPWILYKLDGGIDHILVDEAQDTNQIQWQLVEALSDEFFTGLGSREDLFRSVFAVGDLKQSIYRFQGAEPQAFEDAKARLKQKAEDAGLTLEDCVLNTSYRSTSSVLSAVDAVFTRPEARSGIVTVTDGDEVVSHIAHRLGHHGLVEVWPPERPEEKAEPLEGWQLPTSQKFVHSADARLAEKIARHIAAMIRGKTPLKSRDRPIRYGDFLVLVKTRDAFMDHLIRELKVRNIPVAGSDRMVLADQLVIQDLIALARFTLLPSDDFNLACVLKGPLINFDDEDLLNLAPARKGSLWQALQDAAGKTPKVQRAVAFLNNVKGETPFDFFSGVLGPLGGRKLFVRRLGFEVGDPLDEFLSLALEFEQNHTPSLQAFLKWFSGSKTQIKRDMERGKNEVRIMTIHGAKGLEAPIVYLPDTFKVARRRRTDLLEIPPQTPGHEKLLVWAKKKALQVGPCKLAADMFLEEERAEHNRLLYVALTRAEDRLYICGWEGKRTSKDPTWYDFIRAALTGLEGVREIDGEDDLPLLRLENPQTADPVADKEKAPDRAEAIPLPGWANLSAEKEAAPAPLVRPSRHGQDGLASPLTTYDGSDQGKTRGNIIHKLLEVLPDVPEDQRAPAAKSYLAQKAKALSAGDQKDIWAKVNEVLTHPDYAFIFGPGSQAEASLSGTIDGNFVSAQIDRLVVTDDQITIVDYKSDRQIPARPQDAPEGYIHQVNTYRKLLQDLYPDRKVKAVLLWTEDCTWMDVPEDGVKTL